MWQSELVECGMPLCLGSPWDRQGESLERAALGSGSGCSALFSSGERRTLRFAITEPEPDTSPLPDGTVGKVVRKPRHELAPTRAIPILICSCMVEGSNTGRESFYFCACIPLPALILISLRRLRLSRYFPGLCCAMRRLGQPPPPPGA